MNRNLTDVLGSLGACDHALYWAKSYGSNWEKALEECNDRSWLLWLAGRFYILGYLPRTAIVLCACAYARTALKYVPEGEERPLKAIEAAEKWTRGEATVEEVRAARDAAYAAAYAVHGADYGDSAACAARAAARAAYYSTTGICAVRAVVESTVYAANATYAACAAAAGAAHANNEDTLLPLTKQHLGPALIEGLTKYVAPLEKP